MLIRELFEGKFFKDKDYVSPKEGGREINYDLVDDLIHYMNHDDNVYRRHMYPSIARCIDMREAKKKPSAKIFKAAVEEGYKMYIREFPIRELPSMIDEEVCEEICNKMREEVCKDIDDGKYKD
jgi:hypothetical protein